MASVAFPASGHNEATTVTGAKTLAAVDCGVVQDVTASATLTLPAVGAGLTFLVRVGKEGITLNVTPAGTDQVQGNGFTAAAGKGAVATNQPGGSLLVLVGGAAGAWTVQRVLGTWVRQA